MLLVHRVNQTPLAPGMMHLPSFDEPAALASEVGTPQQQQQHPTAADDATGAAGIQQAGTWEEEEPDEVILERAVRLSWAALQWVPESSDQVGEAWGACFACVSFGS